MGSFGDQFGFVLGSFWDRFGIVLGSSGVAMGIDPPMSSVLSLEALGGLTPLKYAQMFVVGAAVAPGGA